MESPRWFPALLSLLMMFGPCALSQQKQNPPSTAVDWDSLMPKIQTALAAMQEHCLGDPPDLDIMQTGDLTGDGSTVALIGCPEGAYMRLMVVVRIEDGKPMIAKFRDEHGKATDQNLMDGASVMHGAATLLVPEQHAVLQLNWDSEESQPFQCVGTGYVWNAQSKTFDENPKVSNPLVEIECRKEQKIDSDLKSH